MGSLELKRQRKPLAEKMRTIVAEAASVKDGWTTARRAEFDALEAKVNDLGRQAEDAERDERAASFQDALAAGIDRQQFAERKAAQTKNIVTTEMRHNALRAWCFGDRPSAIKQEWRDHARACGIDLHQREIDFNLLPQAPRNEAELRKMVEENLTYRATTAQSVGTAAMGGNLIADDVSLTTTLESALLAFGGQRNISRVIRTNSGADLPVPQTDDTTEKADRKSVV